jgi:predicted RNA-binding protein (virulence factor B family)
MSKKSFKQVIGQLYKEKKILIQPDRILLAGKR